MKKYLIIPKENISRYELEIARSGCCMSLAPISFAEDEACYFIERSDPSGCGSRQFIDSSGNAMFDGYRLLLKYLRTICISILDIEDHLIPCEHISLEIDEILLVEERAVMQISPSGESFTSSMKKLLENINEIYPETHAAFLFSRLPGEFNASKLKKMLISMELDLHYM